MPTAIDRLEKGHSDKQARDAISSCIRQMSHEHSDWAPERVQAACYSMYRERTGRKVRRGGK